MPPFLMIQFLFYFFFLPNLGSFSCERLDQMIFWSPYQPGLFYASMILNAIAMIL